MSNSKLIHSLRAEQFYESFLEILPSSWTLVGLDWVEDPGPVSKENIGTRTLSVKLA
jgi:hypothetical protein